MDEREQTTRKLAHIVLQLGGEKTAIEKIWPMFGDKDKALKIIMTPEMRAKIITATGLDPNKFK